MKKLKEVREGARVREAEIARLPDGPVKRAMRSASRKIGAIDRLVLDYNTVRAGKPSAPTR